MVLLIILISLLSFSVSAGAITNAFSGALDSLNNFFGGGWENYEDLVNFLIFFFLFFTTYLIGAKKAFGKLEKPHTAFAFTAAFGSALLIITTGIFKWINAMWFVWILLGIIFLLLIYPLLKKLGLKGFWGFLLALILAILLLWLLLGFAGVSGSGFGGFGGLGNFLDDLFKGGGWGGLPYVPTTPPPTEVVKEKGWWEKNWWWMLLAFLVPFGAAIGYGWDRTRRRREETQQTHPTPPLRQISTPPLNPDDVYARETLIKKLKDIADAKKNLYKDIGDFRKKYKNIKDTEKEKLMRALKEIDNEIAWLWDGTTPQCKLLEETTGETKNLLLLDIEIQRKFLILAKEEQLLLKLLDGLKRGEWGDRGEREERISSAIEGGGQLETGEGGRGETRQSESKIEKGGGWWPLGKGRVQPVGKPVREEDSTAPKGGWVFKRKKVPNEKPEDKIY